MVAKRSCLTVGSFTEHKVFDLGHSVPTKTKVSGGRHPQITSPRMCVRQGEDRGEKENGGGVGSGDKKDLTLNRVRRMVRGG